MVLGVAKHEIGSAFTQSLHGGVERALVICGYEKLDKIRCTGPTWAWELKDGKITKMTLTSEDFGLEEHPLPTVAGGNGQENAATLKQLLMSRKNIPGDLVPILDSALLVVTGLAKDH